MIGFAIINTDKVKEWVETETHKEVPENSWYKSLWSEYFYHNQNIFKDANPIVKWEYYGVVDNSPKFFDLVKTLKAEGQKLNAYYADNTAVMCGYKDHRYILPANLIRVEYLKDYSSLTSNELSALNDNQVSSSMLPAEMSEYSVKSLEEKLSKENEKITDAKEKCKKAIEEIRAEARRKEQELRDILEKETQKLYAIKEDLENKIYILDTQIYGIRCYFGEVVDFTQIRKGKAASEDTPVVMFQKIRFLDEEMGKYLSLYHFGAYKEDSMTLIEALKVRDDLRDIFCPADRCITVFRNSRTGKAIVSSNKVANMLEQYDYLHGKQVAILIRDKDNLFIGWTDEEKVRITSDDFFLKPGVETVSEVSDEEYGFGKKYWSEEERIKAEKELAKKVMRESVSRYFLISIIQGMVDRGGLINIPPKTNITEESNLIKLSFAEGWLKNDKYGTLNDILNMSNNIEIKKGEIILTGMQVTRDDIYDHHGRYNSEYAAYSNDRGVGDKNRTHGAFIPDLEFMPINKVLKRATANVTFDLLKGTPVIDPTVHYRSDNANAYKIIKDTSGEKIGTFTCKVLFSKDDFNTAGTILDYKKVFESKYENCILRVDTENDNRIDALKSGPTRYEWIPDLDRYGVPEVKNIEIIDEDIYTYVSVPMETYNDSNARVNFEIKSDEYIRTSYLCTTWLKYIVETGHVGDFHIGGTKVSYAEALKYLNNLIEYIGKREEFEKDLLINAGGGEYIKNHPEWDRELCEWRIKNKIATLTSRNAKKFIKEN